MGSLQDSTWRDFPQALADTQGARRYITLFEAPFVASEFGGAREPCFEGGLSDGDTPSTTRIPAPTRGSISGPNGPKFGPVGRSCPRGHLPHEVASPGGGRMPHLRHSWCIKPTRGHDPNAVLLALFWGRATVSMLGRPSSGSRPYDGLVDAPRSELRGHGLFH